MSQLPWLSRETRESIAMYHLRVPQTEEELERYYQFRWEMLRKPLHQPKGSNATRGMRWRITRWSSTSRVIW